ncbi:SDR family oxidoreductase [Paeniglutamicibacter gangotriensis]|uniref:SDR family oxidoreductase n=1 Tax=Paeniglutamicibacter gangotriensis TaxID=254787 RepID=A0A5B0EEY8_9MICC|nr:SDR family oxidoreductase [Paeniglutamicibacter gangotriensis]
MLCDPWRSLTRGLFFAATGCCTCLIAATTVTEHPVKIRLNAAREQGRIHHRRGIGARSLHRKDLHRQGAKVMLFDFNPKSQEVADEIGAKFVQGDVSKAENVEAAVAKTVEEFGRLDIAVASAGSAVRVTSSPRPSITGSAPMASTIRASSTPTSTSSPS